LSDGIWVEQLGVSTGSGGQAGGGRLTGAGTPIDRVRFTTVNGTDTLNSGTINITWE
jgi:hypothetical protein